MTEKPLPQDGRLTDYAYRTARYSRLTKTTGETLWLAPRLVESPQQLRYLLENDIRPFDAGASPEGDYGTAFAELYSADFFSSRSLIVLGTWNSQEDFDVHGLEISGGTLLLNCTLLTPAGDRQWKL